MRARRAAWLPAAAVALLACATTVRTVEYPALAERPIVLQRVAVAPFRASPGLPLDAQGQRVGAALVARYVAEALAERGLEVIAPSDVGHVLGLAGTPTQPLVPAATAAQAGTEFAAQAVLLGSVLRFRERSGEALGTTQPASVSFEVTLVAVPDGERLWTAAFDETQQPLFANLFNLGRYPGGGTRWLTAEELGRWGAREVARKLPRGAAP